MRLAHLTDPHVRRQVPGTAVLPQRRSRESADLLVRALVDAAGRGADAVAITGDLVDVPSYLFEPEREGAVDSHLWAAVRADYRWLRRELEACGLPWVVVPGNHDSFRVMREVFGDRPMQTDVDGVRLLSFWDREHARHVPQRILADRRRFDAAMADPDCSPQVHLQHFPITPELNEGYPHTYREGEELRRRIVDSGRVALSLSGHYHPGLEPQTHGSTLFSVTPALTEAPHSYRIFEVPSAPGVVTWEQIDLVPKPALAPAVFLDRDGCINTLAAYHSGPEAMELIPGAAEAIRRLRSHGYRIVVVTNQSCVGSGYVTPEVLAEVHGRMHELLACEGARVDAVYCSFEAGASAITAEFASSHVGKPRPTMLLDAARTLHLDLASSWMVGDRAADIEAGRAAGVLPILVRTGLGNATETTWSGLGDVLVVDNLAAAAAAILRSPSGSSGFGVRRASLVTAHSLTASTHFET